MLLTPTAVFALLLIQPFVFVKAGEKQQQLIEALFDQYNKLVRPVRNETDAVKIKIALYVVQIIDVDEVNQILNVLLWLNFYWDDYRITWNPSDYGGITSFTVPFSQVWTSDILLFNSADSDFDRAYKTNILVFNDGSMFWSPPGIFRTTCKMNIRWFPFDDQSCMLKFGSWTNTYDQVDLVFYNSSYYLTEYSSSGEWYLRGIPHYRCVNDYDGVVYVDVRYFLKIQRRPLYVIFNLVGPCIMISSMALLVFTLPPDAGEKISLGVTILLSLTVFSLIVASALPATSDAIPVISVTILLSLSVFSLLVAEALPATSETLPLIGLYFTAIMLMCSLSVVFTVLVLNFHHRKSNFYKMPVWLRKMICEWLGWVLRVSRPGKEFSREKILENLKSQKGNIFQIELHNGHTTAQLPKPSQRAPHNLLDTEDEFRPPQPKANSKQAKHNSLPVTKPIKQDSFFSQESNETLSTVEEDANQRLLSRIAEKITVVADQFEEQKATEDEEDDWKFAAMVIDRLGLYLFIIYTVLTTGAILFSAPNTFANNIGESGPEPGINPIACTLNNYVDPRFFTGETF